MQFATENFLYPDQKLYQESTLKSIGEHNIWTW